MVRNSPNFYTLTNDRYGLLTPRFLTALLRFAGILLDMFADFRWVLGGGLAG